VFLNINSLFLVHIILHLIMLFFGVTCVILPTMPINLCPHYACYDQPHFASLRDNTDVVLTLPDSSFPLPQCMRLEMGEPFGVVASFSVVGACFESEDTLDKVHDLAKTPLEASCDVYVHKDFSSLCYDIVLPNPLDHLDGFLPFSLPSPPPSIILICLLIIL